ncbi:MAG: tetratricopeptide repeat protein [Paucibacter sp.]|nr:tetratricopeptide repeat protein [Roseateles sp.]
MRQNDLHGAVQLCDELLAKKSDYPTELQRRKAECLLDMGRFDDARMVYEEVGRLSSRLAWARLGEARACFLGGQVDAARDVLRALIASNEQNMAAYELLAKVAEESGQLDEAMRVLTDAAAKVGSARRHRALGHMALRTGQLHTAKESLKQAVKLSRGSAAAQSDDALVLAQVHVDLGEPKLAHQVLDEVGASLKDDPSARSALSAVRSQAFREQGEHAAAGESLRRALDGIEARADIASILIAKAALKSGDPALIERGARLLEQAVKDDHENLRIVSLARQTLVDTGQQALIASLVDGPAEALKQQVAEAKTLLKEREFAKAVERLDALLASYADNTAVLLETVRAYLLEMSFTGVNPAKMKRVVALMARLDALMPHSEKVQLLHHFLARVRAKEQSSAAA